MEIKEPIFVIGIGRSGSSIFHRVFSQHPDLAWLSKFFGVLYQRPWVNRWFMQAIDLPVIGPRLRRAKYQSEAYDFWENHARGFQRPCRDLTEHDVTLKVKKDLRRILPELMTARRNRLLVKLTGWPRIRYLNEIFPDAYFIHIVRDGRAVVNSMINVDWWWGWRGPQNWRWGELNPEQDAQWREHGRSFIALAAIEWNMVMEAVNEAKTFVDSDRFMEMRYEDLCADPSDAFSKVSLFCNLDFPKSFHKDIQHFKLRNTNTKWQNELTVEQQDMLNAIVAPYLNKHGYPANLKN